MQREIYLLPLSLLITMPENQDETKDLKSKVEDFLLKHPRAHISFLKKTFPSEDIALLNQFHLEFRQKYEKEKTERELKETKEKEEEERNKKKKKKRRKERGFTLSDVIG